MVLQVGFYLLTLIKRISGTNCHDCQNQFFGSIVFCLTHTFGARQQWSGDNGERDIVQDPGFISYQGGMLKDCPLFLSQALDSVV